MKIIQTPVGHMEVFCYLVYDEETKEGILIDPAGDEDRLIRLLREKDVRLKYIVNTHGHADHTCGNERLARPSAHPWSCMPWTKPTSSRWKSRTGRG